MIKPRKKIAAAVVTFMAVVSAFAFVGPRLEAYAATCTYENWSTASATSFDGATVTDNFILYWIDNSSQTGCAHYGEYFFYSRFQTTNSLLLRVGSWDTNGYAYITDQSLSSIFGPEPVLYGAKWNGYSGCDNQGNDACTSGQFASAWTKIPTDFFGAQQPMSGESDYNTDTGTIDPSVVEDIGGSTRRLVTAYITNKGP